MYWSAARTAAARGISSERTIIVKDWHRQVKVRLAVSD
jgi:hypothetical protein